MKYSLILYFIKNKSRIKEKIRINFNKNYFHFHIKIRNIKFGNQIFWMYARPGETRSCIGCHNEPDTTPPDYNPFPATAKIEPVKTLPHGGGVYLQG